MTVSALQQPALAGVGPVRASAIFVGRSLRHSLRDGEGLIMAIVLPVAVMLMFSLIFGGAIQSDGRYIDYVVPGIILLCSGFGAASVAVSVSRDLTTGALRRLRTLPIFAPTVLVGHLMASVLRNLVATAIVIGVGLAIGFRPSGSLPDWLIALGLVASWIVAITIVFAFVGLVSGSPEAANSYGFGLLFLPYISSAFVPIETMPDWLRPVAEHQPMNPLIESVRSLLLGQDPGSNPLIAVAWCAGLIVLGGALIAWRFPRARAR